MDGEHEPENKTEGKRAGNEKKGRRTQVQIGFPARACCDIPWVRLSFCQRREPPGSRTLVSSASAPSLDSSAAIRSGLTTLVTMSGSRQSILWRDPHRGQPLASLRRFSGGSAVRSGSPRSRGAHRDGSDRSSDTEMSGSPSLLPCTAPRGNAANPTRIGAELAATCGASGAPPARRRPSVSHDVGWSSVSVDEGSGSCG
jgi:hypothetical protein